MPGNWHPLFAARKGNEIMIVNENIVDYINSLEGELPEHVVKIMKEALADEVPIIRRETMTLIKYLLKTHKPMRVLEVGAAVGFSSILMSEYLPEGASIITIERMDERIQKAKQNIAMTKKESVITLLEGDATEILEDLVNGNTSHLDISSKSWDNKQSETSFSGEFDFIFMDAAKGQYMNFFPNIMKLLKTGGILLTDNVLQDGAVAKSRYGVIRRDRTIHTRMREYLYTLTHMEELDTVVLPVGDGVTISTKVK